MAVLTRAQSSKPELTLTAIMAQSGMTITKGLHWQLFHGDSQQLVAESKDHSPRFSLVPGDYSLTVRHKKMITNVNHIKLVPHEYLDVVVTIGQLRTPSDYHITNESQFNPMTEHERGLLDRKAQNFIGHDDVLKEPPREDLLRQHKQALDQAGLGLPPHPVLAQQVQFDGAIDPSVNPLPTENTDTVNELYAELEHQLGMQPAFNPKPSSPL